MRFLIVDQCPAPRSIAPYIYLVIRRADQAASSIYRGEDAKTLLHKHGKRTQAEIHRDLPAISNPAGQSQHECRSDGNANPGPVGRVLEEWEVGVDSGGDDALSKARIEAAADHYGWRARHPYSRGVEGHHWCFAERPKATGALRARVIGVRLVLFFSDRPSIKLGSKGRRAQTLKRRLVKLDYLDKYVRGPIGQDAVKAIKQFQRDHKLQVDGVAGPATQLAIARAVERRKAKPPKRPASKASPAAIALIAEFEGFRSKPYRDPVGVWTIGYGETKGIGPNTKPWSEPFAKQRLMARVARDYAPHVARLGLPLTQNQFDALTSVVYNLGPGVLDKGRSLGDALHARDMRRAADAILLYDKAGSPPRALPGLTRRRRVERALFLKR